MTDPTRSDPMNGPRSHEDSGVDCTCGRNYSSVAALCDTCGRCDECVTGASTGCCVACSSIGARDDMKNAGERPAFNQQHWTGRVLKSVDRCGFDECLEHEEPTKETRVPTMAELMTVSR